MNKFACSAAAALLLVAFVSVDFAAAKPSRVARQDGEAESSPSPAEGGAEGGASEGGSGMPDLSSNPLLSMFSNMMGGLGGPGAGGSGRAGMTDGFSGFLGMVPTMPPMVPTMPDFGMPGGDATTPTSTSK